MAGRPVGVVLMAYGTPSHPEQIEAYYTDIRRGRPPTPEALADLTARYAAIGGVSPLAALTAAQRDAIQASLDERAPATFDVVLGMKHTDPKVDATARAVVESGAEEVVGLVLAPHYSSYSIGDYLARCRAGVASAAGTTNAATGSPVELLGIESWATEPALVAFLARDLGPRVDAMRAATDRAVRVLFTAHSLPQRIIDGGDPYPDELRATAEAVAEQLGLHEGDDWSIAWQSAGRTPEPWIGPDILAVIDELGASGRYGGVIVCACGFVADHLEVLYDLDIEAAHRAEQAELAFDRTASVNADRDVMAALAGRVIEIAGR